MLLNSTPTELQISALSNSTYDGGIKQTLLNTGGQNSRNQLNDISNQQISNNSNQNNINENINDGDKQQTVIDEVTIPRVAFMFISKGVIHNEPIWRAFFEAAGRLKLRQQPPSAFHESVEELYGPLHPPLEPLREEQYPGWRILHGIIDPMTYKVLGLKRDIPASILAELIVDPVRYGFDLLSLYIRYRKEVLRLLSLFPGYMIKEDAKQNKEHFTLYDVPQYAHQQPADTDMDELAKTLTERLLSRSDILDNPNKKQQSLDNVQWAVSALLRMQWDRALTGREVYEAQDLFSIYVHPLPGYRFAGGSLFEGREISARVNTTKAFAQHDMVEAEVALMRAALKDPNNHKFVLVSENCIPLHPPEVVWAQLLSETASRTHGCRQEKYSSNIYRWKKQMKTDILFRRHWRKSAQWFVLNRPHAELVVRDSHVLEMFKRYCWSWYDPIYKKDHVCVSDEHAIPTLLASYGLDDETDCYGFGTFTDWQRGGWHPHTWQQEEISAKLLHEVRTGQRAGVECDVQSATESARQILQIHLQHIEMRARRQILDKIENSNQNLLYQIHPFSQNVIRQILQQDQDAENMAQKEEKFAQELRKAEIVMQGLMGHSANKGSLLSQQQQGVTTDQDSEQQRQLNAEQMKKRNESNEVIPSWIKSQGYKSMPKECSIFMRKFPPQAIVESLVASLDCRGVGLGYWCYDEWVNKKQ